MCRIDQPFGNQSLDESKNPYDRFIQALDEHNFDGHFRELLIQHFSEGWMSLFGSVSSFEDALKPTTSFSTDQEKIQAFLSSNLVNNKITTYFHELIALRPNLDKAWINFLLHVVKNYFPSSPYALYDVLGFTANGSIIHYPVFVSTLYGDDFYMTQCFFDDEKLSSIPEVNRTNILWNFFKMISGLYTLEDLSNNGIKKPILDILMEASSLDQKHGAPTKPTHDFLKGIEFLEAWIKHDTAHGRIRNSYESVLDNISKEFIAINDFTNECEKNELISNEDRVSIGVWLNKTQNELKRNHVLNFDLSIASQEDIQSWLTEINGVYSRFWIEHDKGTRPNITNQEYIRRQNKGLVKFCEPLNATHLKTWIRNDIEVDLGFNIKEHNIYNQFDFTHSNKWICEEFFKTWKENFQSQFDALDFQSKIHVLSTHLKVTEDFHQKHGYFFKELLLGLAKDESFPVELTPFWTHIAINKLDPEEVKPYLDKSIGLLRGAFAKSENPEITNQQLTLILPHIDRLQPSKALRHRLMLMRSSSIPFSDKTLSRLNNMSQTVSIDWVCPLVELGHQRWDIAKNQIDKSEIIDWEGFQHKHFMHFTQDLIEFILSRLKLRKGEKVSDGYYGNNQIVESSSVWRQGYLKALTELGFDLGGKVHKAAYFTSKYDPEEDVRSIAKECYRAVRRNSKNNPTLKDLKRGIISAEWWLLLSQRTELKLDINPEEARNTRRRLLRNP